MNVFLKAIEPENAPKALGPYSPAVKLGMQTDSQLLGYCHRGMCCELFFNYTFFFVFYLFG